MSEPYPALKMPPFAGSGRPAADFYRTSSVDIEVHLQNDSTLVFKPKEFFFDAPISHHRVLVNNFKPSEGPGNTSPHQQFAILEPIIPGFFLSRQRNEFDIQNDTETLQWLDWHINRILPEETLLKVSFKWYQDRYPVQNLHDRNRQLIGTTTIPLSNGASR